MMHEQDGQDLRRFLLSPLGLKLHLGNVREENPKIRSSEGETQ